MRTVWMGGGSKTMRYVVTYQTVSGETKVTTLIGRNRRDACSKLPEDCQVLEISTSKQQTRGNKSLEALQQKAPLPWHIEKYDEVEEYYVVDASGRVVLDCVYNTELESSINTLVEFLNSLVV